MFTTMNNAFLLISLQWILIDYASLNNIMYILVNTILYTSFQFENWNVYEFL